MHTYVTLAEFKGEGNASIASNAPDDRILAELEAVSRQFDDYLRRRLYPWIETRYFSGSGRDEVSFPEWDIISVTSLKEDENGDATYETTWASTDYELAPYMNDPTSLVAPTPYWKLEVNNRSNGTKSAFGKGQKRFELAGKFGYCEMTQATGATINEGAEFSSSDTTLTVSDGSKVHVGDTLVIESEYLYISGEDVAESNDLTVVRGVNGSTAAAHADATAISRLIYPPALRQAVLMQASRLWERRRGGYSEQIGDLGLGNVQKGLDQDVRQLLDPYKRLLVA